MKGWKGKGMDMKQKVYCMKCGKDLTGIENMEQCECGSKDFIYGETVVKTEKGFACKCGSEQMEKCVHINMNPKYITTYKCCGCGARISTEVYYESPFV